MQQALSGFGDSGSLGPGPTDDDPPDEDGDGKESPQSGEEVLSVLNDAKQ